MLVIAHRGASAAAPENTLAAVQAAHRAGADAVECDVHRTRDGALVVHHDTTLERTTDVARVLPDRAPWRIADLTLAEIERLDAGSWWDAEHVGEPVLTLDTWLAAVGPLGALVEVKSPASYPGIERDLADVLPAYGVAVQCFDHAWLQDFRALAPDVTVGALFARRPWRGDLLEVAGWTHQVNPRWRLVTRGLVDRVHDLGLTIHPWTVDDVPQMARLAGLGIDGLITNHPERLTRISAALAS